MMFSRAVASFHDAVATLGTAQPDRLGLLRQYAALVVDEGPKRAEAGDKNRRRHLRRLGTVSGACWVCRAKAATTRHHVIALANGGRTKPSNVLGLCVACHRRVHAVQHQEATHG